MKVIDLLNKLAKGKEVPKKIKYNKKIYVLDDTYDEIYKKMYYTKEEHYSVSLGGLTEDGNFIYHLYDEVEIIEEDTFEDIEEITYKPRKVQNAINQLIRNQKKIISKLDKEQ